MAVRGIELGGRPMSSEVPIMINHRDGRPLGYHEGELEVQRRAGVAANAARLARMLAQGELRDAMARFLADRTFAVLTARDIKGTVWISPLSGPPGFLEALGATTLLVHTLPGRGDPLHELVQGQSVGLVVVEFATRRRIRINGTIIDVSAKGLSIDVDQAYANCPQYIQVRELSANGQPHPDAVRIGTQLEAQDRSLIRRADTFFVGTTHPTRGMDASHRGGPRGFLRVDGNDLWWPDYSGNNMFNTLGNLAVDSAAALLIPDFVTGRTLQLSGSAVTKWTAPGAHGDDDATGRLVQFTARSIVAGRLLRVHSGKTIPYEGNPSLRG